MRAPLQKSVSAHWCASQSGRQSQRLRAERMIVLGKQRLGWSRSSRRVPSSAVLCDPGAAAGGTPQPDPGSAKLPALPQHWRPVKGF